MEVTLADSSVRTLPLERLTKLYDGLDHMDDIWGDEGSSADDYSDGGDMPMLEVIGGQDDFPGQEEGDWEDVEDDENMSEDDQGDWAMSEGSEAGAQPELASTPPVASSGALTPMPPATETPASVASPPRPLSPKQPAASSSAAQTEELPWERFEMLSEAPVDHAFYSSPRAQPSKNFMSRLTKEYRVLSNSLPGTRFIVR